MSPGSIEMEDVKRSKTSNGSSLKEDGMEARLLDFCQNGLSLDDETTKEALRLFRETEHILLAIIAAPGSGNADDNERFWFASVLYTVKRLVGGNSVSKGNQADNDTGFTLYQILRVAKIKIVGFLNEMPQFFLKADSILSKLYGNDWEKKLQAKELQANFIHLTCLCRE